MAGETHSQRDKLVDVGFKIMNGVHHGVLAVTGGRFPRSSSAWQRSS